jgi:Fe-Mn family superoxide dismutase
MPTDHDRRAILSAGLAIGTAAGLAAPAAAAPPPGLPVAPQPLPFAPDSLGWMSERLITSHHSNNYGGAVKRLAPIRAAVAGLDPATAPGFEWNGLKREELLAWNSMILHELYFAGLAAAQPVARPLAAAIERDFGSMTRWAAEFAAMGRALAGGSGWVLLTFSPRERRLANQWASDHSQTLAGATPLLALDMYEHAYQMDWGAKAGVYVDAFMKNMTWAEANRRFAALA